MHRVFPPLWTCSGKVWAMLKWYLVCSASSVLMRADHLTCVWRHVCSMHLCSDTLTVKLPVNSLQYFWQGWFKLWRKSLSYNHVSVLHKSVSEQRMNERVVPLSLRLFFSICFFSLSAVFSLGDPTPQRSSSLREKSWLETALKNDVWTSNSLLAAARIRLGVSVYQTVVEPGDGAAARDEAWAESKSSGSTEYNLVL